MNPIETTYSTGATLYAVAHHTDGRVWNNIAQAWEAFNQANWADYAIFLAEQGASGYYRADFPAAAAGDYLTTEVVYQQAGVAPDVVDAPATGVGQSQGVDVAAIRASSIAASNLQKSSGAMVQGVVTSVPAPTDSTFPTTLTDADSTFQGRLVVFTTGALLRQVGNIMAFANADGLLSMAGPFTAAPTAGDEFIII